METYDVQYALRDMIYASPHPIGAADIAKLLGVDLEVIEYTLMRFGRSWRIRTRNGLWEPRPEGEDPHKSLPPNR